MGGSWLDTASFPPLLTSPSTSDTPNSPCIARTIADELAEVEVVVETVRREERERLTSGRSSPATTACTHGVSSGIIWSVEWYVVENY